MNSGVATRSQLPGLWKDMSIFYVAAYSYTSPVLAEMLKARGEFPVLRRDLDEEIAKAQHEHNWWNWRIAEGSPFRRGPWTERWTESDTGEEVSVVVWQLAARIEVFA